MSEQSPQYKKLMQLLRTEIGLTDDERIELAQIILRRDIASFTELDEGQVARLLDAAEGYEKISALLRLRF